jgi:Icc protein
MPCALFQGMTRIAHLSDLHLLEDEHRQRDAAGRLRLSFLSFFRRLDQQDRRRRLRTAIEAYKASGAEHLVVTGDLTEDGTQAQFEVLASVFLDSGLDPREVTFTPGNHDAYVDAAAFMRALAGPLQPFARTSRPGSVLVRDDVVIVPVSTAIKQPIARAAGAISDEQLQHLDVIAASLKDSGRAIVLAQHHQPFAHTVAAVNWVDGLQNHAPMRGLLRRYAQLHVLHGHRHRSSDRPVTEDGPARVFGTTACVDDDTPLRVYEARDGRLWPIFHCAQSEPARPAAWFGAMPGTAAP